MMTGHLLGAESPAGACLFVYSPHDNLSLGMHIGAQWQTI